MPTRRRVAVVSSTRLSERSFLRTSARAAVSSSSGSISSSASRGHLVVDALAPQLLGERPPGQPLARLAAGDPGPGEGLVVDQPDLLEPVEEAGGDVVGDVLLRQLVGQLLADRACPVSGSSRILRATDSVSASGPVASTSSGGADADLVARWVHASTPVWTSPAHPGAGRSSRSTLAPSLRGRGWLSPHGASARSTTLRTSAAAADLRSHRPRAGPAAPRRQPSDRRRASRGSSSRARWRGRGCP